MFNPNDTFKWSVDLATTIYSSNPDADTTWEYIYPQICKYMESRGKVCELKEMENRKIILVDNFEITVNIIHDSIGVSFMMVSPLAKTILDEAYDNKAIFGLPVSSTMIMSDYFPQRATITFMSRQTWEALNTPQARVFESKMSGMEDVRICTSAIPDPWQVSEKMSIDSIDALATLMAKLDRL